MRSMDDPPHSATRDERQALAQRVGDYLTDRATKAGFDVRRRAGGRAQLASLIGVSITTVSRTLEGKTLPLPSQLTAWASVLGIDHEEMLIESGLLPKRPSQSTAKEVPSAALTPDAAMDAWGITDPKIRTMLNGNIQQAIQLQHEIDAAGRGATARG